MYNKVELCGVNTAELPILSEQEKRDLLTRARAGDKEARQSMIEGNLRLVLSVVQRFSQRGENMDDLFQVGCIGLIKAIDNFDPAQQVRFSTYGVPMIIGEIRRFLRDNNALRVSRSLRDTAYRAMQSREELEKQLGREPTVDEIAQKTGLSRREVSAALESVVEPLSLEEPVYADGGDAVYVIDQVRDPDGEDSWISGLQFRQTVAGLTPREKRIMELRYLKGKTQMEVAREIGISQAQVSRLEKAAVCSVGIDMVIIPGDTTPAVISALIADEAAIGMVNSKTTAVRVIPAIGRKAGEVLDFGGLLGYGPIMPVNQRDPSVFINRGGRLPAPMQSLKN